MKIKGHRYSINTLTLICFSIMAIHIPGITFAQYQNQPTMPSPTTVPGVFTGPTSTTTGQPASTSTSAQKIKPKICGEKLTCEITVTNAMDFLKFGTTCNDLEGATIKWKASPHVVLSIKADKEAYCSMKIENTLEPDNPTVKNCTLNREEIANMSTPDAVKALQAYNLDGSKIDQLKPYVQPILDCLGPLPVREKDTSFSVLPNPAATQGITPSPN